MASPTTVSTPYDLRVDLIKETITANSGLDAETAGTLAVDILHALNSIPEKMR
jgi:hypothetical protein